MPLGALAMDRLALSYVHSHPESWFGVAVTLCHYLLCGQVLGVLLWYSGWLQKGTPFLLSALGWDMDQVQCWKRFTGAEQQGRASVETPQ